MPGREHFPLLDEIRCPADLRALGESQLAEVAEELRAFLIRSVSATGGHLGASLGVVELTLALHYVFETPDDRLVWDVGHQAYAHKILTGRREAMAGLRQKGGISGFPKRAESPYDTFGVGHSSTSVGAALGMALAARRQGVRRRAVAIIGDGAMGGGQALEALNHAGDLDADLLVVLNDNRMSISPNVGGLNNYLARLMSGPLYTSMREGSKKVLSRMPSPVWELARRAEEHMKGMVVPGTLFEELGFNYIGPVDGHDLPTLMATLRNLRNLRGPQLLHVMTRKGKGYTPAEEAPSAFHGVGRFDWETGAKLPAGGGPDFSGIFGAWLCRMAARDERLVAVTPAMCEGSGMVEYRERFPERFYDVGIAEQHAVTLAAGLACEGLKPVVAIYSTFLQRGYDQLIHDVALQRLPVLFAIDRGGIVGPDGPTHAGVFDLSFLRCIPELVVMAPSDERECRLLLNTGYFHDGPAAVRYPRGQGTGAEPGDDFETLPLGRGTIRRQGREVALLAFGTPLAAALEVAERIDATVADMRFVKPLDEALILELAANHRLLVTVEENAVAGGAGSGVAELLAARGVGVPLLLLGIPDRFTGQGSRTELLSDNGLDPEGILSALSDRLKSL